MTLLDAPRSRPTVADDDARTRPLQARPATQPRPTRDPVLVEPGSPAGERGHEVTRGMRIRRLRLGSVAVLASVFWALIALTLVGTVVVVWQVARSFGFVDSFEETITTSLGLEAFEVDGSSLFPLVAGAVAALCVFGWLATLALAAVYNAACRAFGGLAVETGPLPRRPRRPTWRERLSSLTR